MIEKEPITVILSQRGWIRAMKGHLALDQVAELKWREGDEPFIHFHAQTTDRLALFAANGRVYTLGGDKLPGGRGFGEPVRLFVDLDAEVEIVPLLAIRPGMKLLVASSDGRGFLTSGERRSPKPARASSWSICGPAPASRWSARCPKGPMASRSIGENRKLLVFPLAELPELGRGQGVTLQRYRDGGLSDAVPVRLRRAELGAGRRNRARADRNRPRRHGEPRAARRGGCRRSASRAATDSTEAHLTWIV